MKSSNRLNFKLQIQGSHLTILAYEAWLGTGPSAMIGCVLKWLGRRSNPRLLGFNQTLYRLSYQAIGFVLGRLSHPSRALRRPSRHKKSLRLGLDAGFSLDSIQGPPTSTTHIATELKTAFVRDSIQSNRVSVGE